MRAYLERTCPAANVARFYAVLVTPTLFGDWSVVREWGRIGQGGTLREERQEDRAAAEACAHAHIARKLKRGYVDRSTGGHGSRATPLLDA